MKMYILIKDTVPLGHAINCAAHAGAMAILEWREYNEDGFSDWIAKSFKKVTCKVTEAEFEAVKACDLDCVIVTESALNNEQVAIAIKPLINDDDYPQIFKYLKLYKE